MSIFIVLPWIEVRLHKILLLLILILVLSPSLIGSDPAFAKDAESEWLMRPETLYSVLGGLCLPDREYGDDREISFRRCTESERQAISQCSLSMTGDDEGGRRYLTNLQPVERLNAVTFDVICFGGDHCAQPKDLGALMLFSSSQDVDVYILDEFIGPQKLVGCESVHN